MSEFVGVKERWVERGWTRKQMRDRIEELGLTVDSWCVLQPYELNFLQNPDANQDVLEDVESGERAIGGKNLWKPGETITVSCDKASVANLESNVKKYVLQDIQPYVSMKFKFVDSGGKILVKTNTKGGSAMGKTYGPQQVNLVDEFFKSVDVLKKEAATRIEDGKKVKLTDKPFNYIRYIIVHEFGHALGLYHQFDREQCKVGGVTCTDDPKSVMNFPLGFSVGSNRGTESTMDHFSPGDIKWLKSVYA